MELTAQYINMPRRDPVLMQETTDMITGQIKTIVNSYSGSIRASRNLMEEMKSMVRWFLHKRNLHTYYYVKLTAQPYSGVDTEIKFVYDEQGRQIVNPGVYIYYQ